MMNGKHLGIWFPAKSSLIFKRRDKMTEDEKGYNGWTNYETWAGSQR